MQPLNSFSVIAIELRCYLGIAPAVMLTGGAHGGAEEGKICAAPAAARKIGYATACRVVRNSLPNLIGKYSECGRAACRCCDAAPVRPIASPPTADRRLGADQVPGWSRTAICHPC